MTEKDFFIAVARGRTDIVQLLLDILNETQSDYCVIGGLAVNAYAEPVVSLDLDLVVAANHVEDVCQAATARGLQVQTHEQHVHLSAGESDLRIQLRLDPRYQRFLAGAARHNVLGYRMSVASLEDVLEGKIWAYSDTSRRKSKRHKDLSDIMRLVETHPRLKDKLAPELLAELE